MGGPGPEKEVTGLRHEQTQSQGPGWPCSEWVPLSFRPFWDSQLDKNTGLTAGLSLPSTLLCPGPGPHSWSRNRGKNISDPSSPSTFLWGEKNAFLSTLSPGRAQAYPGENMWRKGQDFDKLTRTLMTLREGTETGHQLVGLAPGW